MNKFEKFKEFCNEFFRKYQRTYYFSEELIPITYNNIYAKIPLNNKRQQYYLIVHKFCSILSFAKMSYNHSFLCNGQIFKGNLKLTKKDLKILNEFEEKLKLANIF